MRVSSSSTIFWSSSGSFPRGRGSAFGGGRRGTVVESLGRDILVCRQPRER